MLKVIQTVCGTVGCFLLAFASCSAPTFQASAASSDAASDDSDVDGGFVVVAQDSFARTITRGWGAADVGGSWSLAATPSFADGTVGHLVAPTANSGSAARLLSTSALDVDAQVVIGVDKAGSGTGIGHWAFIVVRRTSDGNEYKGRIEFYPSNQIMVSAVRTLSGVDSLLSDDVPVPGLTYAAGARYILRVNVAGSAPSTLRIKAWREGAPEPATWSVTADDSSPQMQTQGSVGLGAYVGQNATDVPVSFSFDDFVARSASHGN